MPKLIKKYQYGGSTYPEITVGKQENPFSWNYSGNSYLPSVMGGSIQSKSDKNLIQQS